MSKERCYCGAPDCWSCGPAQGYPRGKRAFAAWEEHEEWAERQAEWRGLAELAYVLWQVAVAMGDHPRAALAEALLDWAEEQSDEDEDPYPEDLDEDDAGDAAYDEWRER